MNNFELMILALTNVADRGQTTVQVAGGLRQLANELRKLDAERNALDALHPTSG